ncbi:hypothetical protein B0H14DRAFT_3467481 [Mycena olivaceomarginata]|nr:hypothetical protein B0H14DRAFT_3467481 [Mycena olivaceomarginata]
MKLFVLAARASAAAALTARVCAKPSFFVGDARANVVYHPSPVSHHLPSSARPLRSSPAISTQHTTMDAFVLMLSTSSRLAIPFSPPNVRVSGNEYQVEVTNGKDNKTKSKEFTR